MSGRGRLGTALIGAGTFGTAGAQWLLIWLFARQGGTDAVGEFSALFAIATPLFVAAQYGLRHVYLTLDEVHPFRSYATLRLLGCVIGAVVLVLLGHLMNFAAGLILAMTALKVADCALDMAYARLQSREKLLPLGVLMVVNPVSTVILVTVTVHLTSSVAHGVAASACASLVTLGASVFLAMSGERGWSAAHLLEGGRALTTGWGMIVRVAAPVMLTQLLMALLIYLPVWIAQAGGGTAAVGIYAGASYLIVAGNLLGSSLATVAIPAYRRRHAEGENVVPLSIREGLRWSVLGLVGALAAVAFGPQILDQVYGEAFVMSRSHIALLALAAVLTVPTYLLNAVMLVKNRYRSQTLVSTGSVIAAAVVGVLVLRQADSVTAAIACALAGVVVRVLGSVIQVLRLDPPNNQP